MSRKEKLQKRLEQAQRRQRREAPPEGTKVCSNCYRTLPLDEFSLSRTSPGGRAGYCRACNKVQKRHWKEILARSTEELASNISDRLAALHRLTPEGEVLAADDYGFLQAQCRDIVKIANEIIKRRIQE